MKPPQFVALGIAGLMLSGTMAARAQDNTAQTDADRIKALEQQVQALMQQQDQLKAEQAQNDQRLKDLMDQLAVVKKTPPIVPTPVSPPVKWSGDITYRVDTTNDRSVETGLIPTGDRGTVRERFRFNLTAPLSDRSEAGMQLTTGEGNPGSPTSPFIAAGDGFRGKAIQFGRAYFDYHFGDHPDSTVKNDANNDAAVFVGKMPNPFWRGEAGSFASEMVWDNDVNPDGLALRIPLTRRGAKVGVSNTLGYYTLFQTANLEFAGLTTNAWALVDQAKVDAGWLKGSAQYLRFNNLNSGLHYGSSTAGINGGTAQSNLDANSDTFTDPNAGVNAWLLQSALGLQTTNNHLAYGGGANGFVNNHFDILNLTGQVLPKIGGRKYQPWITGDFAHNFAVNYDRNGYGVTLGVAHIPGGGDITKTYPGAPVQGSWSTWLTYRDVDNDATLADLADSDIGAGTGYRGGEFGFNYRIRPTLSGQILAINFYGYPHKENHISRIFLDVIKNF